MNATNCIEMLETCNAKLAEDETADTQLRERYGSKLG